MTTPSRQKYQPPDRWDAILCLALTAFTLTLFFYFLTPPFLSDQLDYFYHAWRTDHLTPSHRHLRIGLIFPVWLVIQLFGYSELSYYAVPAFGALSLTLGTWLVGRMLFSMWTGALAGLLIIFNPLMLSSFTDLLPDYPAAGLFTLAMGLLLWRWQADRLSTQSFRSMTFFASLLAGFLVGWSYLTREYVVIFFPVVLFTALMMRSRVASLAGIALGAASCWLVELIWGSYKYGDPLVRLHAIESPRKMSGFIEADAADIFLHLPAFFDRSGGCIFVFLLVCGMFFCVTHSVRGNRRWQVLALWLVGGWLFFTIVALLPVIWLEEERVYLRMHKFRYWALSLPPAMIAGLAGSQVLIAFAARRLDPTGTHRVGALATGVVTAVFLLGATVNVVSENYGRLVRNGMDDYVQFRRFMETVKNSDEIVLLEHGRLFLSGVQSLPIYLNTWNGADRVWNGRVSHGSTRDLDHLANKSGRILVALDLTRADRLEETGRSPKKVLNWLELAGKRRFESSNGKVVVYELGGDP